MSTFLGKSDPVAVLATIILLSYNTLVQTIVRILAFARIKLNNSTVTKWHYNGEIEYATGYHLALLIYGGSGISHISVSAIYTGAALSTDFAEI